MKEEIWKDIQGYESLYQVSNLGNVRSLRYCNKNEIKVLRQYELDNKAKKRYLAISLSKNNVNTKKLVHRLVAETFIPNPNNYPQVNHIDGNKKNNKVTNLEWCTQKHNIQEAWRLGLITRDGIHGFVNNLPDNRRKIKQYDKDGKLVKVWSSMSDVQKELGYSVSSICQCCKGKIKSAFGYIWIYEKG